MKIFEKILIALTIIVLVALIVLLVLQATGTLKDKETKLVENAVIARVQESGGNVTKTTASKVETTTNDTIRYYVVSIEYVDKENHNTTAYYTVTVQSPDKKDYTGFEIDYKFSFVQY